MAWLRHTWRNLAKRHVALPAAVIFGPILVVALVAALVVQATAADDASAPTSTTVPPDSTTPVDTTPDAAPAYLDELPASCVAPDGPTCSLRTGALALVAATVDVDARPDGTIRLEGDVTIPTSGGAVELLDSEVVVTVDGDGGDDDIVALDGTTDAPLPRFGALTAAELLDGAEAEIGYDWGSELTHLGAHLRPDRQYYWFRFESSWAMQTGFDETIGDAAAPPVSVSTPGDVSVTMVLDPTDPYFYIGGPCPSFGGGDDNDDDAGGGDGDGGNDTGGNGGESGDITVGGGDGEDCGLGVSEQGLIPYEATTSHDNAAEFPAFDGHIVVDHSEIPVMKGVVLDGTIFIREGSSLALGGNGDIFLSVPLVEDALDLSLLIGNASVALDLPRGTTGGAADTFLAGVLDSDLLVDTLPDWLPLEPPLEAEVLAAARVVVDVDEILAGDTFVEMIGSMSTKPAYLSDLTSVDVDPIHAVDALIRMDTEGVTVNGEAMASIHPAIEAGADLTLEAYVSHTDTAATYFELLGAAAVGGVPLSGETSMRFDSDGGTVAGELVTPISTIGLRGRLSDDDILLRGSTSAALSADTLTISSADSAIDGRALRDHVDALLERAADDLADLDAQIETAREAVQQARDEAIAAAERALADAERAADRVADELEQARLDRDGLEDRLDDVLESIRDEIAKVFTDPTRLFDLRALRERLEDEVDDAVDEVVRLSEEVVVAADDLVRRSNDALAELIEEHSRTEVDDTPLVAPLLPQRVPLVEAVVRLERTQRALTGSAALAIDVELRMAGLTGSATGEICGAGSCISVTGGTVRYVEGPQACVPVEGVVACAPF